jgi:hypothetical protein
MMANKYHKGHFHGHYNKQYLKLVADYNTLVENSHWYCRKSGFRNNWLADNFIITARGFELKRVTYRMVERLHLPVKQDVLPHLNTPLPPIPGSHRGGIGNKHIVFTGGCNKGKVLLGVLPKRWLKFETITVVDDSLTNLKHIEDEFKKLSSSEYPELTLILVHYNERQSTKRQKRS